MQFQHPSPDERAIEAVVRIVRRVVLMPRARSTMIVRETPVSVPRVRFLELAGA